MNHQGVTMINKILLLTGTCILTLFTVVSSGRSQVPPDRDALLNGEETGLTASADANGYPGPKRVLDVAGDLKLSAGQKKEIEQIYTQTQSRAKELGQRIISVEKELNESFASGLVAENTIRESVDQIEKLRAKLRTLHLVAHLKTRAVLSSAQAEMVRKMKRAGARTGH